MKRAVQALAAAAFVALAVLAVFTGHASKDAENRISLVPRQGQALGLGDEATLRNVTKAPIAYTILTGPGRPAPRTRTLASRPWTGSRRTCRSRSRSTTAAGPRPTSSIQTTFEKLVTAGRTAARRGDDDVPVTPGKLPHRVLSRMKRDPTRLYTAAELSADLSIRDVQQVRTALARLVGKGLVRRSGVKGEFTI